MYYCVNKCFPHTHTHDATRLTTFVVFISVTTNIDTPRSYDRICIKPHRFDTQQLAGTHARRRRRRQEDASCLVHTNCIRFDILVTVNMCCTSRSLSPCVGSSTHVEKLTPAHPRTHVRSVELRVRIAYTSLDTCERTSRQRAVQIVRMYPSDYVESVQDIDVKVSIFHVAARSHVSTEPNRAGRKCTLASQCHECVCVCAACLRIIRRTTFGTYRRLINVHRNRVSRCHAHAPSCNPLRTHRPNIRRAAKGLA